MAYTIRKTTIPPSGSFRDESTIIRGKEGKRIILLFTGEGCTKFTRIFLGVASTEAFQTILPAS